MSRWPSWLQRKHQWVGTAAWLAAESGGTIELGSRWWRRGRAAPVGWLLWRRWRVANRCQRRKLHRQADDIQQFAAFRHADHLIGTHRFGVATLAVTASATLHGVMTINTVHADLRVHHPYLPQTASMRCGKGRRDRRQGQEDSDRNRKNGANDAQVRKYLQTSRRRWKACSETLITQPLSDNRGRPLFGMMNNMFGPDVEIKTRLRGISGYRRRPNGADNFGCASPW